MYSAYKTLIKSIFIVILFVSITVGYAYNLDSIPLSDIYSGYRIELVDTKISTKTDDKIKGFISVINSGKYPVTLGAIGYRTSKLKVLYDTNFDQNTIDAIITAVINSNISLEAGEMKTNYPFEADLINYKRQWNPATAVPVSQTPVANTEKSKPEKVKKQKESKKKEEVPVMKESPVIQSQSEILSKKDCPDLVISSLIIKKQTKRTLQIEYSLTNQGTVAAQIYDKKGKEYLALAAYFSASERLSRGSLIAGGDIISKGLEKSEGILYPGESFTNTINIDLSSKSRYLNTLILSADSRQVVYECVENNNNKGIPID